MATAGASLWHGKYDAPTYDRIDVSSPPAPANALPFGLASWTETGQAVVVFESEKEVVFVADGGEAPKELARLPREQGLIDATTIGQTQLAVLRKGNPDELGCAPEGFAIVLARSGKDPVTLSRQAQPISGHARPLRSGGWVSWLEPVDCRNRDRKVLYGVLLRADGSPASKPTAIADSDGYAVSTQGDEVSLWMRAGSRVAWLKMTCRE